MLKAIFGSASFFVIAVFAMAASSAIADPPGEVNVNCNSPGGSAALQEAIDSAVIGLVINVQGTCTGNYVVTTDDVELQAKPNAELVAADGGTQVVTVEADDVVIEGFSSIRGGGAGNIFVHNGSSAIVRDNVIENSNTGNGVSTTESSHVDVTGNTIQNNSRHGVSAFLGGTATLVDNVITGNGTDGVLVSRSSSVLLIGNTITLNERNGVGMFSSSTLSFGLPVGGPTNPNTIENNHQNLAIFGVDVNCTGFSTITVGTQVISATKTQNLSNCLSALIFAP